MDSATQTADVSETIRRSVKALMAGRGQTVEGVAPAIGMAVSTMYRRLAGKGERQAFSAGETARLALYFGVPVSDLFDGLGGRVVAHASSFGSEGWGFESLRVRPLATVYDLRGRLNHRNGRTSAPQLLALVGA